MISSAAAMGLTLTFEENPVPASNTQVGFSVYDESGFRIKPLGMIETATPFRLRRTGPASTGFPDNGTAFLQLALQDSFEMTALDGSPFTPTSIDLAEYSTAFTMPSSVFFTGYFGGGGSVTAMFDLDGVIDGTGPLVDFQTFLFPSTFAEIVRLESTTNSFSIDNLVVTPVPEPSGLVLLLGGAGLMACRRRKAGIF